MLIFYVSLLFGVCFGGWGLGDRGGVLWDDYDTWDTWASVNFHGNWVNFTGVSLEKMYVSYLKITSEETLRRVDFLKSTCGQVVNVIRCHRKDIKMFTSPCSAVNWSIKVPYPHCWQYDITLWPPMTYYSLLLQRWGHEENTSSLCYCQRLQSYRHLIAL